MLTDPLVRRARLDEGLQIATVWLAARHAAAPAIPAPAHSDDDVRRWFAEEVLPSQVWVAESHRFYERHGFALVESTDGRGNEEQAPDRRYRWSG